MPLDKYRIKIRKNPDGDREGLPKYSLTYRNNPAGAGRISHEILSAFIGRNDVIIEINSDMSGPKTDRVDPVEAFLDKTDRFGLVYVKKNVLSEKDTSIFGIPVMSRKRRKASEALIYIPNSVWCQPGMGNCLPIYGAKYYITDGCADARTKLDELSATDEEDRMGAFGLTVFDLAAYGQMGIYSNHLSMDDIKRMLGS
jgi:hypothetical protein